MLVALLVLAAVSCTASVSPRAGGTAVTGSGVMASDTRGLTGFTAVELRAVGNLDVERGGTTSIRIEADDNLLPHITTVVRQGVLVIDWAPGTGSVTTRHAITYHLSAPQALAAATVHGAGAIHLGALQGDTVRLGVDGAGSIAVDAVQSTNLVASIGGAGRISAAGQARHQQLTIDGLGTYQAAGLATQQADVTITGAGHAQVRVSDALNATIDGVGSVQYAGTPRVTRHGTGLGQVIPMTTQ